MVYNTSYQHGALCRVQTGKNPMMRDFELEAQCSQSIRHISCLCHAKGNIFDMCTIFVVGLHHKIPLKSLLQILGPAAPVKPPVHERWSWNFIFHSPIDTKAFSIVELWESLISWSCGYNGLKHKISSLLSIQRPRTGQNGDNSTWSSTGARRSTCAVQLIFGLLLLVIKAKVRYHDHLLRMVRSTRLQPFCLFCAPHQNRQNFLLDNKEVSNMSFLYVSRLILIRPIECEHF